MNHVNEGKLPVEIGEYKATPPGACHLDKAVSPPNRGPGSACAGETSAPSVRAAAKECRFTLYVNFSAPLTFTGIPNKQKEKRNESST